MSVHDAVEFLVRLSDDPDLFDAVATVNGEAMVQRALEMGFSFTSDELTRVVASSDLDPAYAGTELSGDDLDAVSGGAGFVSPDIAGLVQSVLRETYLESTADLRGYADKVRRYNSAKKSIRDRIS